MSSTPLLEQAGDPACVAGSLTRRYITASLLISRLQAQPRQGQLTKLLQAYGRLIKTLFVPPYLHDHALCWRGHAYLNKGEKLHDLWKFLFFATVTATVLPGHHEKVQGEPRIAIWTRDCSVMVDERQRICSTPTRDGWY
jgi:hypothetical protein